MSFETTQAPAPTTNHSESGAHLPSEAVEFCLSAVNTELKAAIFGEFILKGETSSVTATDIHYSIYDERKAKDFVARPQPFSTRQTIKRLSVHGFFENTEDTDEYSITNSGLIVAGVGGLLLASGKEHNVSIMPVVGYTSFGEDQHAIESNMTILHILRQVERNNGVALVDIIKSAKDFDLTGGQIRSSADSLEKYGVVTSTLRGSKPRKYIQLAQTDSNSPRNFQGFVDDYFETIKALAKLDFETLHSGQEKLKETIEAATKGGYFGALLKRGFNAGNRKGKKPQ